MITNPIVEIAADGATATCRSYYTVIQQTDDYPLQPVCAGRYHDEFEKVDGKWRYRFRDYSLLDLKGDFRAHAKGDVPMIAAYRPATGCLHRPDADDPGSEEVRARASRSSWWRWSCSSRDSSARRLPSGAGGAGGPRRPRRPRRGRWSAGGRTTTLSRTRKAT
ncbi:MAG: nuclear transport factor 2 family protein [Acidimicrobiia bacterium]